MVENVPDGNYVNIFFLSDIDFSSSHLQMFDFIMYILNSTCNTPCRYMIYDMFMKQGLCEHRLFLNNRKCIEYLL